VGRRKVLWIGKVLEIAIVRYFVVSAVVKVVMPLFILSKIKKYSKNLQLFYGFLLHYHLSLLMRLLLLMNIS
jgi:hypothetical protein